MSPAVHAPASALRSPCPLLQHPIDSPPTVPFSTPTGGPEDALHTSPAYIDQTQPPAQPFSSPTICISTPLKTPHPCASMGRSLKQLCSRFSCWKQGKWPTASGFPSSQSPCSPFPSHVTPKKDLDLLLCHLNSIFLSCLLDPPRVFLGERLFLQIRDLHTTALGRPNPPGYIYFL